MDLFTVDREKCNNDGICAEECPAKIIKMTERGPEAVAGAGEICIQCGHCVGVCPEAALSLNFLSPDQCMPIQKELELDEIRAEHFLRSRRAIRSYRKKPVPAETIEKALAIASSAPTGSNRQPVKWLVVNKKEDVKAIGQHVIDWMAHMIKTQPETAAMLNMEVLVDQWNQDRDRICRGAPQLVFAHASQEFGSAPADCHTAIAYLELALPSFGAGSCWAGYVNYAANQWPPLVKKLNLPENHRANGAVMLGYPKYRYHRAPMRNRPDITYM